MRRLRLNNVRVSGRADGRPVVFAHGFGCDQHMWRFVAPDFERTHKVVLFDHVGCGGADSRGYDAARHSSLEGYADDVLAICTRLGLRDAVLVGHSVSATICMLAAARARPGVVSSMVMVSPSPRFLDDDDYVGGFTPGDIDDLLDLISRGPQGWSGPLSELVMGNPDRPSLAEELATSFCRADPELAPRFAEITFRSDHRRELAQVSVPTLVVQCLQDSIAPVQVGRFVHASIPGSRLVLLEAAGHCPNLSAPEETTQAIASFLRSVPVEAA